MLRHPVGLQRWPAARWPEPARRPGCTLPTKRERAGHRRQDWPTPADPCRASRRSTARLARTASYDDSKLLALSCGPCPFCLQSAALDAQRAGCVDESMMPPSRTARRVAERRAAHQLLDAPVVLNDPLALRI